MSFQKEFKRGVILGMALSHPHKNCEAYQEMVSELEAAQLRGNEVLIEHDSTCPCSTDASREAAFELAEFIEKTKAHA